MLIRNYYIYTYITCTTLIYQYVEKIAGNKTVGYCYSSAKAVSVIMVLTYNKQNNSAMVVRITLTILMSLS